MAKYHVLFLKDSPRFKPNDLIDVVGALALRNSTSIGKQCKGHPAFTPGGLVKKRSDDRGRAAYLAAASVDDSIDVGEDAREADFA